MNFGRSAHKGALSAVTPSLWLSRSLPTLFFIAVSAQYTTANTLLQVPVALFEDEAKQLCGFLIYGNIIIMVESTEKKRRRDGTFHKENLA